MTTPGGRPAVFLGAHHTDAGEVRRLAGLPGLRTPVSAQQAYRAGCRLARHPSLAGRLSNGHDVVPDVVRDAGDLLLLLGVRLEILRTRQGLVSLRATGVASGHLPPCPLVKGLVGAIPEITGSAEGALVEVACRDRGHESCLYSLVWRGRGPRLSRAWTPTVPPGAGGAPPSGDRWWSERG